MVATLLVCVYYFLFVVGPTYLGLVAAPRRRMLRADMKNTRRSLELQSACAEREDERQNARGPRKILHDGGQWLFTPLTKLSSSASISVLSRHRHSRIPR